MAITNKIWVFLGLVLAVALFLTSVIAAPTGPNTVNITDNQTKGAIAAAQINVSGGYIAYINVTATVQNTRWKAFVGSVTGKFTLADSTGSSIYDWTLATVTGRIYTTRNSSSVAWSSIQCANNTLLEWENLQMNHTSRYDNITATFNSTNHTSFYVGTVNILNSTCPTLATFRNNAAQNTFFQEVTLTDTAATTGKIIYSTKLEQQTTGFDNNPYDFQMIVPENGLAGNTAVTPYYLYVELS
jgi:hypothetical protein